ncbi:MAG: cell division protein FtsX [Candidatus Egerieousia sp.]
MEKKENKIIRRRIRRSYVSSIISISLVLFIVGFFAVLVLNAGAVSNKIKQSMRISVILRNDVADTAAIRFSSKVAAMKEVDTLEVISKEQGTKEMKEMLGESFLDVFESNPIPVSIDVTLRADYFHTDSIGIFKETLLKEPEVDEVYYQTSVIDAINKNMRRIGFVLTIFIILLMFVSIVLINNTVRLNIFSKRFSIHTMKLVGATKGFIMKPFLKKSVYQGLLSGVIAMAALVGTIVFISRQVSEEFFLVDIAEAAVIACALCLLGVLICVVCTYVVVNRMTSMSVDELYY